MANSIAQLFVELGINTAAFKDGLDKATYMAKAFAGDLKNSFSEVGDSVMQLGTQLLGLPPGFDKIASKASDAFELITSGAGGAAGAAGGLIAVFGAAGVAALGVAVSFSETAARLEDLSHATGMTVESLSALGQIASTKGIDVESMAKSMERMEKSALAAAEAGPKAKNAYTDLGIAVTDAQGRMRSAQELFDDISTKFAAMPDGPEKTAEAMKIFGRAGANMIALLDEGGAKLNDLKGHFEALNSVVSGPTAQASEELKENMALAKAAFTGVENELTADLVPALNVAVKAFVDFFEQNQSGIKAFVDGIAEVAKVTLNVFQELGLVFSLIYRAFFTAVDELQVFGSTVGKVMSDIAGGHFGDIYKDVKTGGKEAADEFKFNMQEAWKSIEDTGKNMVGVATAALPKARPEAGPGNVVQGKAVDTTFIDKAVDALARQAQHEDDLSQAIGKVSQSTIDAKAAAEARLTIQKLQDEADQKGIGGTEAFRAKLAAATAQIQESTKWIAAFQAVIASQAEFDKFDQNVQKQIASLTGEAAAMSAAQREFAKNDATLTPLRNNVAQLAKEWDELAANPATDPKRLEDLAAAIRKQNDEIVQQEANVRKLDDAWVALQASKELEKINQATDELKAENVALLSSNPYGKLEADLAKFVKTMGIAPEAAAQLTAALKQQEQAANQQGALKVAQGLGFDPAKITQLNDYKNALKDMYAQGKISGDEYERTVAKIDADMADIEAKTGGMGAQVKSAFADFNNSVQDANNHILKDLIGQGIKGISDNFTNMIVKGKADWQGLIDSMEAALLKSAINNILNSIFKEIGGALSGQGGFLGSLGSLFGPPHALGGSVVPGMDYVVGENGPEVMRIDKPATVYPNGHSPSSGGQNINQNFNISTPDANSFRRSSKQISSQMYREASYAHARQRGM